MTYKEFYNWTKQYLGTRLENKTIDITPIVEKLGEINNMEDSFDEYEIQQARLYTEDIKAQDRELNKKYKCILADRIKINGEWYVKENTQKKRSYMLGDTLSLGFDYEGMLDYGLKMTNRMNVNDLEKLLNSFEDVNYHREANPLYDLIEHIKYQNEYGENEVTRENINESLHAFKKECEDTLKNIVNSTLRIEENG